MGCRGDPMVGMVHTVAHVTGLKVPQFVTGVPLLVAFGLCDQDRETISDVNIVGLLPAFEGTLSGFDHRVVELQKWERQPFEVLGSLNVICLP
jgi:hypothetical protein